METTWCGKCAVSREDVAVRTNHKTLKLVENTNRNLHYERQVPNPR